MDRLTRIADNQTHFMVDHAKVNPDRKGYTGEAINKLGRFEDFYEGLVASQSEIPQEMQKLRNEGKEKSFRYKELMGKKLTNSHILSLLEAYDI